MLDRAAPCTKGDLNEPCGPVQRNLSFMEEEFFIAAFADFLKPCLKISGKGGHPGAAQQNPGSQQAMAPSSPTSRE